MKAVINRNTEEGLLNGVPTPNDKVRKMVIQHLLNDSARFVTATDKKVVYYLESK